MTSDHSGDPGLGYRNAIVKIEAAGIPYKDVDIIRLADLFAEEMTKEGRSIRSAWVRAANVYIKEVQHVGQNGKSESDEARLPILRPAEGTNLG